MLPSSLPRRVIDTPHPSISPAAAPLARAQRANLLFNANSPSGRFVHVNPGAVVLNEAAQRAADLAAIQVCASAVRRSPGFAPR